MYCHVWSGYETGKEYTSYINFGHMLPIYTAIIWLEIRNMFDELWVAVSTISNIEKIDTIDTITAYVNCIKLATHVGL